MDRLRQIQPYFLFLIVIIHHIISLWQLGLHFGSKKTSKISIEIFSLFSNWSEALIIIPLGAAEATGLGFVCFVVFNLRVLSANRADLGFFINCFINFSIFLPSPPPQPSPGCHPEKALSISCKASFSSCWPRLPRKWLLPTPRFVLILGIMMCWIVVWLVLILGVEVLGRVSNGKVVWDIRLIIEE